LVQPVDDGDGKRAEEVRLAGGAARYMHALGIYPARPDGKRANAADLRALLSRLGV
jgi:hypothetical protein